MMHLIELFCHMAANPPTTDDNDISYHESNVLNRMSCWLLSISMGGGYDCGECEIRVLHLARHSKNLLKLAGLLAVNTHVY